MESPTDIFTEPSCSFCGAPAGKCRVLIHNETVTAFVCEVCAPLLAVQARDIVSQQEQSHVSH